MEIPKMGRQNKVYMLFWIKERKVGVWDFKGSHREMRKSKTW